MRGPLLLVLTLLAGCAGTAQHSPGDTSLLLTLTPTLLDGSDDVLVESQVVGPVVGSLSEAPATPATGGGDAGTEVTVVDGPGAVSALLTRPAAALSALPSVVSRLGEEATITVRRTDAAPLEAPPAGAARPPLQGGYVLRVTTRAGDAGALDLTVSFTEFLDGAVVTDVRPVTATVPTGSTVLVRAPRRTP